YGTPEEGKTRVRTHIGDARNFVDDRIRENEKLAAAGKPPITYDFVYGDAFNDLSVPWHLTTREFSERIARLLTPGQGVYLVNIIDIYPRARFPPDHDRVGFAEIEFTGTAPPTLLPDSVPASEFVACRGAFPGLQVSGRAGAWRLRYNRVMTKETRDGL